MKILVVDDSRAMRMIVRRALREAGYGEHTVIEATNGVEALEKQAAETPDLILADWNMPEMNGLELLEKLRAKAVTTTFGFVTSEGTPQMRQTAADAGAHFLIAKPFTADAFKEALGKFVG